MKIGTPSLIIRTAYSSRSYLLAKKKRNNYDNRLIKRNKIEIRAMPHYQFSIRRLQIGQFVFDARYGN